MKGKLTRKIRGTTERPRLSVFRSLNHIYVQAIDDEKGITVASASTKELKSKNARNNVASAKKVGEEIAKLCIAKGVKKVVFDRGTYLYHGRIAALAEAARAGGLEF